MTDRAANFNIALDDVSITSLTFGKEFTAAIEAKQVAAQEAERAKFVVEKAEQDKRSAIIRAQVSYSERISSQNYLLIFCNPSISFFDWSSTTIIVMSFVIFSEITPFLVITSLSAFVGNVLFGTSKQQLTHLVRHLHGYTLSKEECYKST